MANKILYFAPCHHVFAIIISLINASSSRNLKNSLTHTWTSSVPSQLKQPNALWRCMQKSTVNGETVLATYHRRVSSNKRRLSIFSFDKPTDMSALSTVSAEAQHGDSSASSVLAVDVMSPSSASLGADEKFHHLEDISFQAIEISTDLSLDHLRW